MFFPIVIFDDSFLADHIAVPRTTALSFTISSEVRGPSEQFNSSSFRTVQQFDSSSSPLDSMVLVGVG